MEEEEEEHIRILGTTGKEGKGENQFAQPRGVCINHETKELFVVDCNNHRIQVYHLLSLAYIRQIGKGTQGNSPGCLMYPVGICMDQANNIFVADTNNHRIVVFNYLTGGFIRTIGSQGAANGCLNCPYGVCIDHSTNLLYVADYENNRVQVFDSETGDFIKVIGKGFGKAPGKFNQPIDVCIDQDTNYLYVADYANNRVQVLHKESGDHVHTIASPTTGDAFNGPRSLCINKNTGLLFISDRENHRIQVYDKTTWILKRHIGGPNNGVRPGLFNRPMELCIDNEEGVLIAVDGYNHRVQIMEIEELRLERERLRNSKRGKSTMLTVQTKDAKPSQCAISSCLFRLDRLPSSLPHWKARFHRLAPHFDIIFDEDWLSYLQKMEGYDSIVRCDKSSFVKDVNSIMEMSQEASGPLQKQAASFLGILRQLAEEANLEESVSLAGPSIFALEALICRGWVPEHIPAEVISIVWQLIQRINLAGTSSEESSRLMSASFKFLNACISSNASCREQIYRLLVEFLKCEGNGERVKDIEGVNGGFCFRTLMILDMLSTCLSLADPSYYTLANFMDSDDGATFHTLPRISVDIMNALYGGRLANSLFALHPLTKSYHSTSGPYKSDNARHSAGFNFVPDFVGELVDASLAINCGKEYPNLVHDFLSKCVDVFSKSNLSEIADQNGLSPSKKRGGRNIWRGDRPIMVGDLVDCMDKEKSWFESIVLEVLPYGAVKVHFLGWGSKWDDTVPAVDVEARIAPLNSYTKDWRGDLFDGGLIEIKCNDDLINQKWMWGRISRLNREEEWVEISYSFSNEPVVTKRAWLYGETICPVGMHTKDKSKAASAAISRPVKSVDDILKERATDLRLAGDDVFLDVDDDLELGNTLVGQDQRSLTSDHSSLFMAENNKSLKEPSSENLPSFVLIANYIFFSTIRSLVVSISHDIFAFMKEEMEGEGIILDQRVVQLTKLLLNSPLRVHLVRLILRPLYVHASCCARILSCQWRLDEDDLSRAFIATKKIERLKEANEQVLRNLFEASLSPIVLQFISNRMKKTIDYSGYTVIAARLLEKTSCEAISACPLLKVVMSDIRFHFEHVQSRNLLRGIISSSSAPAQQLIQFIQNEIMTDLLKGNAGKCASKPISGIGSSVDFFERFVDTFRQLKSVVTMEEQWSPSFALTSERALSIATSRLTSHEAQVMGELLARGLSKCLVASEEFVVEKMFVAISNLADLSKYFCNEEMLFHFKQKYLMLALERVFNGELYITSSERSLLKLLPNGEEIICALADLEASQGYCEEFLIYLVQMADNEDTIPAELNSFLANPQSLSLTVCHTIPWSNFIPALTFSRLRLPEPMSFLVRQFEKFFKERTEFGKRQCRLMWCHGYGKVLLSVIQHEREVMEIEVNELQCSILWALQERTMSLGELSFRCGIDLEVVKTVVRDFIVKKENEDVFAPLVLESVEGVNVADLSSQCTISIANEIVPRNGKILSYRKSPSYDGEPDHLKRWRRTLIDAAVCKITKRLSIRRSDCTVALIADEAVQYLHFSHQASLFSTQEVLERVHALIKSGLLEVASMNTHSMKRLTNGTSLGKPSYRVMNRITNEDLQKAIQAVMTCGANKSGFTCQSSFSDWPLADSIESKVEHGQLCSISSGRHRGWIDWASSLTWLLESKDRFVVLRAIPLTHDEIRDTANAMKSVEAIDLGYSSFSRCLKHTVKDIMQSTVSTLSFFSVQMNILLHQHYLSSSIDSNDEASRPLASMDRFLTELSRRVLCQDEERKLSSILVRHVFFYGVPELMVKEYCQIFRRCLVDAREDVTSFDLLIDSLGKQTFASNDAIVEETWEHKFLMKPFVEVGEHEERALYLLVTAVRVNSEDCCGEVSEGKNTEEPNGLDDSHIGTSCLSESEDGKLMSLLEFVLAVLDFTWERSTSVESKSTLCTGTSGPMRSLGSFSSVNSGLPSATLPNNEVPRSNTYHPTILRSSSLDRTPKSSFSSLQEFENYLRPLRASLLPSFSSSSSSSSFVAHPTPSISPRLTTSKALSSPPHKLTHEKGKKYTIDQLLSDWTLPRGSIKNDRIKVFESSSNVWSCQSLQALCGRAIRLINRGLTKGMTGYSGTSLPLDALLQDNLVRYLLNKAIESSASSVAFPWRDSQNTATTIEGVIDYVMKETNRAVDAKSSGELDSNKSQPFSAVSYPLRNYIDATISERTLVTQSQEQTLELKYAELLEPLAEATGWHWSHCSELLCQSAFQIEDFFELAFARGSSSKFHPFCCGLCMSSSRTQHPCEYCGQLRAAQDFFSLTCGHFACKDCWRAHLLARMDKMHPIGCIAEIGPDGRESGQPCIQTVDVTLIHLLLPERVNDYLKRLFRDHVSSFKMFHETMEERERMLVPPLSVSDTTPFPMARVHFDRTNESVSVRDQNGEELLQRIETLNRCLETTSDDKSLLVLLLEKRFCLLLKEFYGLLEPHRSPLYSHSPLFAELVSRIETILDNFKAMIQTSEGLKKSNNRIGWLQSVKHVFANISKFHQILNGSFNVCMSHGEEGNKDSSIPSVSFGSTELEIVLPAAVSEWRSCEVESDTCASEDEVISTLLQSLNATFLLLADPQCKEQHASALSTALTLLSSYHPLKGANNDEAATLWWQQFCRFVEHREPAEVSSAAIQVGIAVLNCLHTSERSIRCFGPCWQKLAVCFLTAKSRNNQEALRSILQLISLITQHHISATMHNELISKMRQFGLREAMVHLATENNGMVVDIMVLASILVLKSTSFDDPQSLQELLVVLSTVFAAYDNCEIVRHAQNIALLDQLLLDTVEKTNSSEGTCLLIGQAQQHPLPLSALKRLWELFAIKALDNKVPPPQLHAICASLMALSAIFSQHLNSIPIADILAKVLRDVVSSDTIHFLTVCSMACKLVLSLCIREGNFAEAFKTVNLVNTLKAMKQHVVALAVSRSDSFDIKSRCNLCAFTISTAIQSITSSHRSHQVFDSILLSDEA